MSEKLDKLKARQEQIKAQIQKEVQRDSTKKRKEETRKKILIGSMMLNDMRNTKEKEDKILQELNVYLKNKKDRTLFGFGE
jgi:hypothetical protein